MISSFVLWVTQNINTLIFLQLLVFAVLAIVFIFRSKQKIINSLKGHPEVYTGVVSDIDKQIAQMVHIKNQISGGNETFKSRRLQEMQLQVKVLKTENRLLHEKLEAEKIKNSQLNKFIGTNTEFKEENNQGSSDVTSMMAGETMETSIEDSVEEDKSQIDNQAKELRTKFEEMLGS